MVPGHDEQTREIQDDTHYKKSHPFERLCFGTDVPVDEMDGCMEEYTRLFDELEIPQDIRDRVMGGNIVSMLGNVMTGHFSTWIRNGQVRAAWNERLDNPYPSLSNSEICSRPRKNSTMIQKRELILEERYLHQADEVPDLASGVSNRIWALNSSHALRLSIPSRSKDRSLDWSSSRRGQP